MSVIRLVIADDADLVIAGAQAVLHADPRFRVVGTARCADQLHLTLRTHPADLLLLNEWLYNLDLFSAVADLRATYPDLLLIIMGALGDGLLIRDLLDAGIHAYLFKSDDLCTQLITAIDYVRQGRLYLSPTASAEYLSATQARSSHYPLDAEAHHVLQLLAHGEHATHISSRLGISKRRVYWIREKLRRRLGAKTNEHLIQRATAEGLILPRD